jgi:hypothetical protein
MKRCSGPSTTARMTTVPSAFRVGMSSILVIGLG